MTHNVRNLGLIIIFKSHRISHNLEAARSISDLNGDLYLGKVVLNIIRIKTSLKTSPGTRCKIYIFLNQPIKHAKEAVHQ